MIVVDASVLATALADDHADGELARDRLVFERLVAPELIDLEMVSVFRRLTRTGQLKAVRAAEALVDLGDLPLQRHRHTPLLARCWELRDNLTAYDASYVALAELLGVTLLTADRRLRDAPGIRCAVELLTYEAS